MTNKSTIQLKSVTTYPKTSIAPNTINDITIANPNIEFTTPQKLVTNKLPTKHLKTKNTTTLLSTKIPNPQKQPTKKRKTQDTTREPTTNNTNNPRRSKVSTQIPQTTP